MGRFSVYPMAGRKKGEGVTINNPVFFLPFSEVRLGRVEGGMRHNGIELRIERGSAASGVMELTGTFKE